MANDPFCDNPECVYHDMIVPEDTIKTNTMMPSGPQEVERAAMVFPNGDMMWFCNGCRNAIALITGEAEAARHTKKSPIIMTLTAYAMPLLTGRPPGSCYYRI